MAQATPETLALQKGQANSRKSESLPKKRCLSPVLD